MLFPSVFVSSIYFLMICYDLHPIAVDPSKQNPFAPKPIFPAPTSLNSSVSSSSSMSASSPSPSPRTSLSKVDESPTGAVSVDKTDGDRNDMNNNDDDAESNGRRLSATAEIPVRKIAGKKISALFEV